MTLEDAVPTSRSSPSFLDEVESLFTVSPMLHGIGDRLILFTNSAIPSVMAVVIAETLDSFVVCVPLTLKAGADGNTQVKTPLAGAIGRFMKSSIFSISNPSDEQRFYYYTVLLHDGNFDFLPKDIFDEKRRGLMMDFLESQEGNFEVEQRTQTTPRNSSGLGSYPPHAVIPYRGKRKH